MTFVEDADCLRSSCNGARFTQTVTWRTPRTRGVEIRVYGVTECLSRPAQPKAGSTGPCLVEHTVLPKSVRHLLATAPASDGKVSWSWTQETGCNPGPFSSDPSGPWYYAVVVGAYGPAGLSVLAIAAPGAWYEPLPGEVIC